jgi:hypothetical protein
MIPAGKPRWRDPLSVGFEAHRGLMLLRLRWHASSAAKAELAQSELARAGDTPAPSRRGPLRPRRRVT